MDGRQEFEYFSDLRQSYETYATSRILAVGKNPTAQEAYERLMEAKGESSIFSGNDNFSS